MSSLVGQRLLAYPVTATDPEANNMRGGPLSGSPTWLVGAGRFHRCGPPLWPAGPGRAGLLHFLDHRHSPGAGAFVQGQDPLRGLGWGDGCARGVGRRARRLSGQVDSRGGVVGRGL